MVRSLLLLFSSWLAAPLVRLLLECFERHTLLGGSVACGRQSEPATCPIAAASAKQGLTVWQEAVEWAV